MFPGFDPQGFFLGLLLSFGVPWIVIFLIFAFLFTRRGNPSPQKANDLLAPTPQTSAKKKKKPKTSVKKRS